MCVRFSALGIFALDADVLDSNGSPRFKKDDIFCADAHSNWYRYVGPQGSTLDPAINRDPELWPNKVRGVINLFRNYWVYVEEIVGSEQYNLLHAAPVTIIK